ncbi:cytochrome c [Limimaricola soesokkakensis]|uniref:Cytochrome c n=1 Tax=Limimaricola soesokkakensis TaxID=1343159 RepID=A0A1X6Z315_9RHOB|nr:cytochrome c [Limimaricola soesokkakensis]PSK81827.1 cytochrome c [Limimaricola soesokkakensis]SLN39407.1 Cytochrome c [Limimaricola soesokkakensis]
MRPLLPFVLLIAGTTQAQEVEDPLSIEAGHDLYMVFCQSCHGPEARGDGPFAEVLKRVPPDLTRLSERNGGSFPVARATRQIDGRDPLLGHGGEMPVFGPVFDTDFGTLSTQSGQPVLTSQSITDLIHWLESIQVAG